jgi:hypothetical protein
LENLKKHLILALLIFKASDKKWKKYLQNFFEQRNYKLKNDMVLDISIAKRKQ